MPENPSELSNLQLMRQLCEVLPERSRERNLLQRVVAGLSTVDTFTAVNDRVVEQTHHVEIARQALSELLPVLRSDYASNPLVAQLLERYDSDGTPRPTP